MPGKIPKKSTVAIKGTDGSAIITGVNRETVRPPRKGGPLPGVSKRTARELHRMMEQANVQLKQPYRDLGAVNKTRITAADLTRFTKILHSPVGLSILTQGENPNASQMVHQTARPGTAEMVSAAAATQPAATGRQSQSPSALPAGLSQARLQEHDKDQQPPAPLVRAPEEDTDYESLLDDDDDDDDGDEVQVVEDGSDNRPTQPGEALRLGVPVKRPAPSDREDPSAKKPRVGAASTNAPSSAPPQSVKRRRTEEDDVVDEDRALKRSRKADNSQPGEIAGAEEPPMEVDAPQSLAAVGDPSRSSSADMPEELMEVSSSAPVESSAPVVQEMEVSSSSSSGDALESHMPEELMDVSSSSSAALESHMPDELKMESSDMPALPHVPVTKRKAEESLGRDPPKMRRTTGDASPKRVKSIEQAKPTSEDSNEQASTPLALPAPEPSDDVVQRKRQRRGKPPKTQAHTPAAPGVRVSVKSVKTKLLTRQLRPIPNARFVRDKTAGHLAEIASELVSHASRFTSSRPGKQNFEALAAEIGHRLGQAAHVQAYKKSGESATSRNRTASDTMSVLRKYPSRIKRLFKQYMSKGLPQKRPITAEESVARDLYHLARGRRMSGGGIGPSLEGPTFVPYEDAGLSEDDASNEDDDTGDGNDEHESIVHYRLAQTDGQPRLEAGEFDEPHFTMKMRGGGIVSGLRPTQHLIGDESRRETLLDLLASLCDAQGIVLA